MHPRTTPKIAFAAGLAALLALSAALPAQRAIRKLTTSPETHAEARLSANGRWVAYRTSSGGTQALGIINTDTGSREAVLYSGAPFTSFVWSPDSTGLYFQTGNAMNFVRTVGGPPVSLGTVSGVSVILHDVDPTGTFLIGTRTDSNFADYSIWRFDTNAQNASKTLFTLSGRFMTELTIDPTGKKIGYVAQAAGSPFAPHDIRRVDIDGQNDISLSDGVFPDVLRLLTLSRPRNLAWADDGKTMNFSAVDQLAAPWQIYQVSESNGEPRLLTDTGGVHYQTSTPSFQQWMVFRGTVPNGETPVVHHNVIGLMPPMGGGAIMVDPEQNWVITDAPSIDGMSIRAVFCGYPADEQPTPRPSVYMFELDRELRVHPRAELAKPLTFELPVTVGEAGTVFLAPSLLPLDPAKQITIPGLNYRVAIDPTILFPVLSGVGSRVNGSLQTTVTVPNDLSLVGFKVYLQGMRIRRTNPDEGDFTRWVELPFFE